MNNERERDDAALIAERTLKRYGFTNCDETDLARAILGEK